MANFEVCIKCQSPRISHTDFLHPRGGPPSLLPTPDVVDAPLKFLAEDNGHVASWSEADNRGGSSPHRKGETKVVGIYSSNFCAVVAQRRRRGPLQVDEPDPSGVVLLLVSGIALLPPISRPPLPTLLSQQFLPLFTLDVPPVLSISALGERLPPQHIFWPSWPRSAHHRSQKCYQVGTWW